MNNRLFSKANFYNQKIWGVTFKGKVEFTKGQRRDVDLRFWGRTPTITFKRELAEDVLEYSLDDHLIRCLTRCYCQRNGLTEEGYLIELESHALCTKESFFIHNKRAYTGSVHKSLWNPTVKLIELNLEFDMLKSK